MKSCSANEPSLRIPKGYRSLTITALRLARYFGTSEQFWMGLQADYDLEEARKGLGRQIDAIERAAA